VTDDLTRITRIVRDVEPTEEEARIDEAIEQGIDRPVLRARRLGGVSAFDYLSSTLPLAGTYRAIMGVFLANSETFGISIPTEQMFARLQGIEAPHEAKSVEHLEGLLETLERWGTVSRTQDASLAKTIEDLKRKRNLWRITEEGRIAEEAARRVEASFGEQGALRSNVLAVLESGVNDLLVLAQKPSLDAADGRTADNLLRGIFSQAKELADSASAFIANLDDFLSTPEITSDAFTLARDIIVGYVGGFLTDLRSTAPVVAAAIGEVESAGVERLIRAAAESNTPPSLDADVDPLELETARIRDRWQGVAAWFVGSSMARARSRDLADRASDAITSLLRILARLNDARHRTISRSRDFVALASWFEGANDDATAHRIWHAAFGLAGARHLRYPYPDEESIRASESWWTHQPVRLEPQLRTLGRYDSHVRPTAIEDTHLAQERLREKVRERAAARSMALERFLDWGGQRFSSLPELSDAEFDLVCECLMTALCTRREADGSYLAPALDGRYLIRLMPAPSGSPIAEIRCPRGALRGADHEIELISVATRRSRSRVAS
jgi:uncharacterized protein (TIGR02677 family)